VVTLSLHVMIFVNLIPKTVQLHYAWPWALLLAVLPARLIATAPSTGGGVVADIVCQDEDARPPLQRAQAIWVVRDVSSAQSIVDLLSRALLPLLRGAPPGSPSLEACIRVTIHVTTRGAPGESELLELQMPKEMRPLVSARRGRPDFSSRLSALELLDGLETRHNHDATARADTRPYTSTQVYFCGNPVVQGELAQVVARENVVCALANIRHHLSFSGESFSAGQTRYRAADAGLEGRIAKLGKRGARASAEAGPGTLARLPSFYYAVDAGTENTTKAAKVQLKKSQKQAGGGEDGGTGGEPGALTTISVDGGEGFLRLRRRSSKTQDPPV
jgi:hypothetical protein